MSCQAPPALDELTLAAGKQPTNVPAPRYVTHCAREHGAGLSLCRPPLAFGSVRFFCLQFCENRVARLESLASLGTVLREAI